MKNKEYYRSNFERLTECAGRLNSMIEDGSFYELPFTRRYLQVREVKQLYNKLRGPIGEKKLISVLAAASIVVLGVSACGGGGGGGGTPNIFAAPVQNPFGLTTSIPVFSSPVFTDLDSDGDLDLLEGDYYGTFAYYQNTGTASAPAFALPVPNPFGLTGYNIIGFSAFADLDGDGDMDIMESGLIGFFAYYQNTGTAVAPAFALPAGPNPFGLTPYVSSFVSPTLADLDGDGDLDLLAGDYFGNFYYYQNTGTANAPAFGAPSLNPFGLTKVPYYSTPAFADLDGDGDLDLLSGDYYGNFHYFQNTGTANAPAFAAQVQNPLGLTKVAYNSHPAFADLDGDGDMDLIAGDYYGNFQYFENTTIP